MRLKGRPAGRGCIALPAFQFNYVRLKDLPNIHPGTNSRISIQLCAIKSEKRKPERASVEFISIQLCAIKS